MAKGKKKQKEEVTVTPPPPVQKLETAAEINNLVAAHRFFSEFDRVPGSYANPWSQALDAIAHVANSLIAKAEEQEANKLKERSMQAGNGTQPSVN